MTLYQLLMLYNIYVIILNEIHKKGKDIPVTGRGGPVRRRGSHIL
jgi:hypothetical protein